MSSASDHSPCVLSQELQKEESTYTSDKKRKLNPVQPEQNGTDLHSLSYLIFTIQLEVKKRQWESWSIDDKHNFFVALKSHGRNFDVISTQGTRIKKKYMGEPSTYK